MVCYHAVRSVKERDKVDFSEITLRRRFAVECKIAITALKRRARVAAGGKRTIRFPTLAPSRRGASSKLFYRCRPTRQLSGRMFKSELFAYALSLERRAFKDTWLLLPFAHLRNACIMVARHAPVIPFLIPCLRFRTFYESRG